MLVEVCCVVHVALLKRMLRPRTFREPINAPIGNFCLAVDQMSQCI